MLYSKSKTFLNRKKMMFDTITNDFKNFKYFTNYIKKHNIKTMKHYRSNILRHSINYLPRSPQIHYSQFNNNLIKL